MQRTLWFVGLVVFLAACSPSGSEDQLEDPLVLELGGDNPHMAPALRKRAAEVLSEPSPVDDPQPVPDPDPVPPRQRYREIALPDGGSLYKLCSDHLGDGTRWPDIAKLNGWTEAEVKRLRPGTLVKLPLQD